MQFERMAHGVYLLKAPLGNIWTGIYLVTGQETALIDSGTGDKTVDDCLIPALRKLGLSLSNVDYLLNTHTHADHVGGHFRIKQLAPHIRVVTSPQGKSKLEDPFKYNVLIRKTFPDDSPPPTYGLKGVPVDRTIGEGEKLGRLRLLSTPGHDDDCVSWFDEETGTLMTGDSLQQNGTEMQGAALYMNLEDYRASIRKLQELPLARIISGHPFLPRGAAVEGEEECRAFLAFCLDLTDQYETRIAEWNDGTRTPQEIARLLIRSLDGTMPKHLFLALYTVTSHLKFIKRKG